MATLATQPPDPLRQKELSEEINAIYHAGTTLERSYMMAMTSPKPSRPADSIPEEYKVVLAAAKLLPNQQDLKWEELRYLPSQADQLAAGPAAHTLPHQSLFDPDNLVPAQTLQDQNALTTGLRYLHYQANQTALSSTPDSFRSPNQLLGEALDHARFQIGTDLQKEVPLVEIAPSTNYPEIAALVDQARLVQQATTNLHLMEPHGKQPPAHTTHPTRGRKLSYQTVDDGLKHPELPSVAVVVQPRRGKTPES
jgi:hypothetical protein